MEDLSFYLLFFRENGVSLVVETDADILAVVPLYHTGHDILFLVGEMFKKDTALLFLDLLHNDASRMLSGDPAKILRCHLDVDNVSQLVMDIPHLRVFQTDLRGGVFHLFHYCLFHKDRDISGLSVHIYLHDGILSEISVTGCHQRIFNRLHNHFFFDIFLFL